MHTAINVTSAGTDSPNLVWTEFKHGRKKNRRVWAFLERNRASALSHHDGEPNHESRVTNP